MLTADSPKWYGEYSTLTPLLHIPNVPARANASRVVALNDYLQGSAPQKQSCRYGAGHLKSTKNQHKNNLRKLTTTTTSLRRYGFIEVLRRHSSLILCFLIFNQNNISGDSKISNYPCMMVFKDTFAKPDYFCMYYVSIMNYP